MAQTATIKELIVAAAEGASEGIKTIRGQDIAVELDRFEIEVTYVATTEVKKEGGGKLALNFRIFSAKIGGRASTRSETTYGLTVRFVFTGKTTEEGD